MWHDLYGTGFIRLGMSRDVLDKPTITTFILGTQNNVTQSYFTVNSSFVVPIKTLQCDSE